jgi:peptidyl-prolyl cis-trans isomerase C
MKPPRLGSSSKIALGLALTILLPLVAVGLSVVLAKTVTRLPANAAFEADGGVVPKSVLEQRVRVLGALYGLRAPADPARMDEFRRGTAHVVAVSTVLDRAIEDRHLTMPDDQARQMLTEFIQRGIKPSGQEAFVQLLRDTGASEGDVLDELKRQHSTALLYRQVTERDAKVTDDEVRAYFQQHPAEMASPEQRHLRNIVVGTQAQAAELLNEIRGGADFGAVATRSTLDGTTRDSGGDLGVLAEDQLQKPYADAAFAAPQGGVFGPMQTDEGWNVGQVLEIRPRTPLGFDQVHDQLAAMLRERKAEASWQKWLDQRIAAAEVRYADEYAPTGPGAISPVADTRPIPTGPDQPTAESPR